jgi:hypothetical protein
MLSTPGQSANSTMLLLQALQAPKVALYPHSPWSLLTPYSNSR